MNAFNRYFMEVIKNRYARFRGRAPRREFWYFFLFSFIILILSVIIGEALGLHYISSVETISVSPTGELMNVTQHVQINLLQLFLSLALFIPSISISIRRLHDLGKSAWWYLIGLIPLIGALVLLAFFVMPSQEGNNEYGRYPAESNA